MSAPFDARDQAGALHARLRSKTKQQRFIFLDAFLKLTTEEKPRSKGWQSQQRKRIEAISRAMSGLYVHQAFKRARYGANPLEALAALSRNPPLAEADFNRAMLNIFLELHDPHTNYTQPEPYQSATAFLPFQVAICHDDVRGERFVVTHVAPEFQCPGFGPRAEITHWNGLPIGMAVQQLAFRENGANPAACLARAIFNLTVRPLRRLAPPDAPTVTLRYIVSDGSGEVRELMVDWSVRQAEDPGDLRALLFDLPTPEDEGWKIWKPDLPIHYKIVSMPFPDSRQLVAVGVIRIRKFDSEKFDEIAYVNECAALADFMQNAAPLALLIDVRGNGGGHIPNGERILQLFSPSPITPTAFQFLNTPLSRQLASEDKSRFGGFGLEKDTGADYSKSNHITAPEDANDIGQRYYGRVALIVDAHCYSTTDIFAAGFQDHRIGPVVGVDPTTGGGGANVFSYNDQEIAGLTTEDGFRFPHMPGGIDLEISVRRCLRTGRFQGEILEDFGVTADFVYRIREIDLFYVDCELYKFAVEKLVEAGGLRSADIRLEVALIKNKDGQRDAFKEEAIVHSRFEGADWAEIVVNGKIAFLADLRASGTSWVGVVMPSLGEASTSRVDVRAYRYSRYNGTPFHPAEEVKRLAGRHQFSWRLAASRTVVDGAAEWRDDRPEAAMTVPPIRYPAIGEQRRRILYFVDSGNRRAMYEAVAVVRKLLAICEGVQVIFVTYQGGASELIAFGAEPGSIIEMEVTRRPSLFAIPSAFAAAWASLANFQPLLIVAHEAFEIAYFEPDLPAPCVLLSSRLALTGWLPALLQGLPRKTLLLDDRPDPDNAGVALAGRPCRELRYWSEELGAEKFEGERNAARVAVRQQARKDAGLPQRELIVAVFTAPWGLSEVEMPISRLVKAAFALLKTSEHRQPSLGAGGKVVLRPYVGKRLVWDRDAGTKSGPHFEPADFDRMMAACDLAICNEDPGLIHELEVMGTPTIVLSGSWDPEAPLTRYSGNQTIPIRLVTPPTFHDYLAQRLSLAARGDARPAMRPGEGIVNAAREIRRQLQLIESLPAAILEGARQLAKREMKVRDFLVPLQEHLRYTDEPKDLIEAVQSVLVRADAAAREPDAPRDRSRLLSPEACAEMEAVIARFS